MSLHMKRGTGLTSFSAISQDRISVNILVSISSETMHGACIKSHTDVGGVFVWLTSTLAIGMVV